MDRLRVEEEAAMDGVEYPVQRPGENHLLMFIILKAELIINEMINVIYSSHFD